MYFVSLYVFWISLCILYLFMYFESLYVFLYLFMCISISLCVTVSFSMWVCLTLLMCTYLFLCVSLWLSVYFCLCLSIYLPVSFCRLEWMFFNLRFAVSSDAQVKKKCQQVSKMTDWGKEVFCTWNMNPFFAVQSNPTWWTMFFV